MDFIVDKFEEVESTNLVVRAALEQGKPAGYVARARVQTGGYGRQGRQWASPAGGLYQSLLLRPARACEEWPTLALVVALGLRAGLLDFARTQESELLSQEGTQAPGATNALNEANALDGASTLDDALAVKWPNDLMVGARKLAGISCEAHGGGVCVGIGVNVFVPPAPFDAPASHTSPASPASPAASASSAASGDKNTPAYLSEFLALPYGKTAAATDAIIAACGDAVLERVGQFLEQWERAGFAAFQRQYCETCNLLGKFVHVVLVPGGNLAQGIVADIDASGRLVIEDEAHNIQAFSSGEVHLYN